MTVDTKEFQPKDLSPEELAKMSKEVEDKIIVARVGFLLRHPFFGNMATRLKIKSCDTWCPTAATDGRHLYYNTQFFNELTEKQIEFVIAHEILHCVYDHMSRRDDRNPMLYNVACDYLVNNLLLRERIGEKVTQIPIFQDYKYDGWTSEEVYDELKKKSDEEGEEFIKELGDLLDEHMDWSEGGEQNEQGSGSGDGDTENGRPRKLTAEEIKAIKDEVKEGMLQAAQAAGAGNVPGEIKRMIQDLPSLK